MGTSELHPCFVVVNTKPKWKPNTVIWTLLEDQDEYQT